MPRQISWVPGAVAPGTNIDLPSGSPPIGRVVSATITRLRSGFAIPDHAQAAVVAALASHAAHSHALAIVGGQAAGVAIQFIPDTDAGVVGKTTATTRTLPGPANSGIQDAAAMAHAAGATPVAHAPTAASPTVSATPTRVDEDTITLSVATEAGDVLALTYEEVGARAAP